VVGQVVATRKDEGLAGVRLVLLQPCDNRMQPLADFVVAADGVQSLEGDVVVYVRAREASHALPGRTIPSDCSVVARVDAVDP
jgi:ethanolamine utilization protein EutN